MFRAHWLVAAGLALGIAACGPSAQQAPAGGSSNPAADSPKSGGVLRHWEATSFSNMDPTIAVKGEAGTITAMAYNSLLGFKHGPGVAFDELTLQPELAESWEVSPDAKTYTFHLRKGVKFADIPPVNGRELTSADVKFSFEYFAREGQFKDKKLPANQFGFQLDGLEAVDTPDPYTAIVRFKEPYVPFLNYSGTDEQAIMAHEIYDQDGDFTKTIVGTGPWQLDTRATQQGSKLVWKKNPTFYETGKPYLDAIETVVIPEEATALAAFRTKQIDLLRDIRSPEEADTIMKGTPDAKMLEYFDIPGRMYLNTQKPPFNDVRVRKAVNLAADRSEYIKTFSAGKGQYAPAGVDTSIFTQDEAKKMLPYDPEEAKRLLREAGYGSGGPDFEILYTPEYGDLLVSWTQLFQDQLKRVGMNPVLKPQERTTMSRNRRDGNFQASPSPFTTLQPDIDGILYAMFHPSSDANYGRVNDPKLTALIEASRKEPDPQKRLAIVREAGQYINDQALGFAFYFGPQYVFWQPGVKNYSPNKGNKGRVTYDVWMDK